MNRSPSRVRRSARYSSATPISSSSGPGCRPSTSQGYWTFREFKVTGGSEGYTQAGLGVRARLPFRVFQTVNQLVADVAHTW
ncbi:hypothetical protein [Streptomyces sp. NPDC001980]|uniref:AMIN-like domain-containing (lipo)protein n=1 Tax=Streptomyces sp. NPDC001980 TaxID=3157126 RepID=UPI00332F40F1